MKRIAILAAGLVAQVAYAGGFEIIDQSPAGIAMAGAGAAKADGPDAVFYNPAGMAMQHGLGILAGGTIARTTVDVTPLGGATEHGSDLSGLPTVFVTQRIGAHFGVGIGVFSNFASAIRYAPTWSGRRMGTSAFLKTLTINPSVAIRPIPRVSIGLGLDVGVATLKLSRVLGFGGSEGTIDIGSKGTFIGANVGILVQVVKRYLDLGVTYRSVADADVEGHAVLALPPELATRTSTTQDKIATMTFPHNLTFALHSRPTPRISLAVDAHLTLWSDLQSLDIKLVDPVKASGAGDTFISTPLKFRNSYGVRGGVEYFVIEHVAIRLGVGYDRTPIPASTLAPLMPDGERVLVGAGLGLRYGAIGLDVGYQSVIVLPRVATNPEFPARYEAMGHLIGIALVFRGTEVGGRLNDPDYKR